MKLISYKHNQENGVALFYNGNFYSIHQQEGFEAATVNSLLADWEGSIAGFQLLQQSLAAGSSLAPLPSGIEMLAPVPRPTSCRDAYAFRQHVATSRRNRKVPMIPEFDQFPVFYFTNHNSIKGPGDIACMPDHFQQLDFELEVAIVICKEGRNIPAADADQYIGGYMIMNDLSARKLQMEEMTLNLGPAKGKDFCTVIGPTLVTPQELVPYLVPPKAGHTGNCYNLQMSCTVNGRMVSEGNFADMDWTFAEIIERCSYGVTLYPGDVIGSGTVGTGCFLELNGTGTLNDPNYTPQWLQPGDTVSMTVDGLGTLTNTLSMEPTDYSLLALKKNVLL